jgi:HD-GYP domain-containing protein (c-di-GMP phosphodiesterase class II)
MADTTGPVRLRLAELVAVLSLGQDAAFGQPLESQLRGTLLAGWIGGAIGLSHADLTVAYWCGHLRYLGCTGHAHEVAGFFGDDIQARARTLLYNAADPKAVLRDVVAHAAPDRRGLARVPAVASALAGGRRFAAMNFRTGCEVGDVLAQRLGMPDDVRHALQFTFERWNGKGQPTGAAGQAIPLPMRLVHLAQDVEVLARQRDPVAATAAVGERAGSAYDPELAGTVRPMLPELLRRLAEIEPWDGALAAEPRPHRTVADPDLDEMLSIVADFADLKSVYTAGHSRAVADLAGAAAVRAGLAATDVERLRRAGLVHDLGRAGVPNSIWDKPGPLTRAERDRVRLHPLLTAQMLDRSPGLATLLPTAGNHHEQPDGGGYPRGLDAGRLPFPDRLLAAADRYRGLRENRAHRPGLGRDEAANMLRADARGGHVDPRAVECVLAADGHLSRRADEVNPAALTGRELQVLGLLARGSSTRAIAQELTISPKTADTHIQHIYLKIGCSTRGAAALFAAQHGLLP